MNKIVSLVTSSKFLLVLILLTASCLRLYDAFDIPYTFEELSSLLKNQNTSIYSLIQDIKLNDTNPPLIQVFLHLWVSVFGYANFILKLPFILMGIASVYLIYLIGRRWFDELSGLAAASFLATIEGGVVYSQIASPYSSALFFTLFMVYHWDKFVFNGANVKNTIGLIVGTLLCAYNENFNLFFAFVVILTGFLFINREHLKRYLLVCLVSFLLYLPNIGILIAQVSKGGLSWLGAPEWDYPIYLIKYFFHDSGIMLIPPILLAIYMLIFRISLKKRFLFLILSISWFVFPLLAALFYSKWVNPILQEKMMIFTLPFLFLFITGFIREGKLIFKPIIVLMILLITATSLIYETKHYSIGYQGVYEGGLKTAIKWKETYKAKSMAIIVYSEKNMVNLVIPNLDIKDSVYFINDSLKEKSLQTILKNCKADFITYIWAHNVGEPSFVSMIQEKYPIMAEHYFSFNSAAFFFTKDSTFREHPPKNYYKSNNTFEQPFSYWYIPDEQLKVDSTPILNHYIKFNPTTEFGINFKQSIDRLYDGGRIIINITAKVRSKKELPKSYMVFSIEDGKNVNFYKAYDLNNQYYKYGEWQCVYFGFRMMDLNNLLKRNNIINFHFWNSGKNDFEIDDVSFSIEGMNPYIYNY